MISRRIAARKDGRSSASAALRYGAGLNIDRTTGLYIDKAHRIRLGGFGLIENGKGPDSKALLQSAGCIEIRHDKILWVSSNKAGSRYFGGGFSQPLGQ